MDAEVAQISLLVSTSLSHEKVRFRDIPQLTGRRRRRRRREKALFVFKGYNNMYNSLFAFSPAVSLIASALFVPCNCVRMLGNSLCVCVAVCLCVRARAHICACAFVCLK